MKFCPVVPEICRSWSAERKEKEKEKEENNNNNNKKQSKNNKSPKLLNLCLGDLIIKQIYVHVNLPFWMEDGLSDTILKEDNPRTIAAKFGLIWFHGLRGEDLNVIFHYNMPNLHNRYNTHSHKNGLISTVFQSGLKSVWNIATCVNIHLKALFESFKMIYNMHIFIYYWVIKSDCKTLKMQKIPCLQ